MIHKYPNLSGEPTTDRAIWNLAHAIWDVLQVIQDIKSQNKPLSFSISPSSIENAEPGKLVLKVSEVAESLSISRNRVYELIRTKQIPAIRFGTSVRVPRKALEELINESQLYEIN